LIISDNNSKIEERRAVKMNKIKIKMTEAEVRVLILALNELRNRLIEEGRYTDAVDELMIRLAG